MSVNPARLISSAYTPENIKSKNDFSTVLNAENSTLSVSRPLKDTYSQKIAFV